MTGSMGVTEPIRISRPGAPRIGCFCRRSDAAIAAPTPICHDFAGFMNIRYRAFSPPREKKWGATHVGQRPAMFSSHSERTMASVR